MADQTVRQEAITLLPEYQETFLKDLLASTTARAQDPTYIPERQVAGLTPGQQAAIDLGYGGVGAYMPMLQAGEQTLGAGAGAIEQGIGTALSGAPMLMGSAAAYDPRSYQQFMDPYMEDVIQRAQADIARQGEVQAQGIRGRAIGQGAFGGSRQAVAEQELQRNIMDQQARTGAQLRSQGFNTAQQMAQNAFQNQMARQQSAAQIFGQLGQGIGALGSSLAKTGLSQAALGEAAQTGQQKDINALLSLGGLEQQQAQQQMEAQRATELERQYEPYQRISFMSDIFRGVPSTQTTLTSQTAPSPSAISQIAGLGVGLGGLAQTGLFDSLLGRKTS
jgi:hypothetical protein